jgi:hypothetical protein
MNTSQDAAGESRLAGYVVAALAVLILAASLVGFGTKFVDLVLVARGEPDGVFAVTPIVNYLLASLGFLCLMGWAAANGMFHDIEQPKRTMLENEERLDAPWHGEHPPQGDLTRPGH